MSCLVEIRRATSALGGMVETRHAFPYVSGSVVP